MEIGRQFAQKKEKDVICLRHVWDGSCAAICQRKENAKNRSNSLRRLSKMPFC